MIIHHIFKINNRIIYLKYYRTEINDQVINQKYDINYYTPQIIFF